MDLIEIFRVSIRAIFHNKVRSALTMLGISIGVASVILLVSIGNGLQGYISGELNSLGSTLITILPGKVQFSASGGPPAFSTSKLDQSVLDLIKKLPSVVDADGGVNTSGVATYKNTKIYLTSIVGGGPNLFEIAGYKLDQGRFFNSSQYQNSSRVVVLGAKAAKDLFGENSSYLDKEISISGRVYTVIGVAQDRGSGFGGGGNTAIIPATTYFRQFGSRNYAEINIRASESAGANKAAAEIKRALGRKLDPENDFTVFTQEQLLTSVNSILGAVTTALGGIAAISLLVGGIGIMNIMLVSVTERTREIGLRKAVGAKPYVILLQFLLEAVVLSLIGGLLGIAIGAGGSLIINSFIKTAVTPGAIILASGVSALIGIVFGTAPAISAARKDPIVALRYE